jgi:hypothetical protein
VLDRIPHLHGISDGVMAKALLSVLLHGHCGEWYRTMFAIINARLAQCSREYLTTCSPMVVGMAWIGCNLPRVIQER